MCHISLEKEEFIFLDGAGGAVFQDELQVVIGCILEDNDLFQVFWGRVHIPILPPKKVTFVH